MIRRNVRSAGYLLTLCFVLLACASNRSGDDDRAVMRAVLESIGTDGQCVACLIESETRAYTPWVSRGDDAAKAGLDPDLLLNYAERNTAAHVLATDLPPRFRFIKPNDVKNHFANGPREGWERLKGAYGERVALVRISMPGYSRAGDLAMVTYSYDYGPLGGETNYVVLRRVGGGWSVEQTKHLLMS